MLSILSSLLQIVAFGALAGVLVILTEKVVMPVLRRLPRSEHLGRSDASSGGYQFANNSYDGGGSCDNSGSSNSDSGGGSSC